MIGKQIILEINAQLNEEGIYEQGIFLEPYGVPTHVKEHVVYTRYETGGYSGGSCWDDSDPKRYNEDEPKNKWRVLDILLSKLCQQITYLQYREITANIHTNEETQYEYYGNSTDYKVEYIKISTILNLLKT